MDPLRTKRVEETMREELSELIRFEMADPRLLGSDVVEVHCAPDLKKADVLVSIPGGSPEEVLEALMHARGFLRHQLMQRMELYRMPELRFLAAIPSGAAVSAGRLMRRIRRGRPKEAGE
jgi:ribosome-binding factor A